MDFDDFGGMPADEYFLEESLRMDEEREMEEEARAQKKKKYNGENEEG